MKRETIQLKFLKTVIAAMLAITLSVGGLGIYEVDHNIQVQTEDYINATCQREAAEINDIFGGMEKSVRIMESYVFDLIKDKADIEDEERRNELIQQTDRMFANVAKNTDGAIAYYLRFDPEISDHKAGLFYSKVDGSDEYVALEPTDIALYDREDTEHVGWFWQPYDAGEPVWMMPYYNQNNNVYMISYVVPMYHQGTFIGVVGMDFDYTVLVDQVHKFKVYENGFAHIEVDGVVVHGDGCEMELAAQDNSGKYLRVSKRLANGMTLVLSASYADIRQIRYEMAFKLLCVVVVLSAVFTVITIVVVRKIVAPLKKIADASVKLSNGDYNVEFVHSGISEIALLNAAFENMAEHMHEREMALLFTANWDSLTGLRNTTSYKSWVAEFEKEMASKTADFGVVVFDVNQLKETNDVYGHSAGNKLIMSAAKVIADTFKRSPVFRIGGDEFVAVLRYRDLEDCEDLFAQLDAACANTFIEERGAMPISIAKGFARFDADTDAHFEDVFRRADYAMYANKRQIKGLAV